MFSYAKNITIYFLIIILSSCSILEKKKLANLTIHEFNFRQWLPENESNILIIAIHGYNAHAGSFEIPATLFSKHNIETLSFDLKGFGVNKDFGEWYPLKVHLNDVYEVIKKISKDKPKKKIFLLGESMGAAIAISLANKKRLPISGLILVSPAIWNFSEKNFFKSFVIKSFSKIFPKVKLSGNGIIKTRPSNNIKMLEEYSSDPLVIHKPTAESLNGVINLMDKAYTHAKSYLVSPYYPTLIIMPLIDEIVPRRPIINLFKQKNIFTNFNKNLYLTVYENNFHMILRDIDGDKVSWEIKEWILNKKKTANLQSLVNGIKILESSKFFHRLD